MRLSYDVCHGLFMQRMSINLSYGVYSLLSRVSYTTIAIFVSLGMRFACLIQIRCFYMLLFTPWGCHRSRRCHTTAGANVYYISCVCHVTCFCRVFVTRCLFAIRHVFLIFKHRRGFMSRVRHTPGMLCSWYTSRDHTNVLVIPQLNSSLFPYIFSRFEQAMCKNVWK